MTLHQMADHTGPYDRRTGVTVSKSERERAAVGADICEPPDQAWILVTFYLICGIEISINHTGNSTFDWST